MEALRQVLPQFQIAMLEDLLGGNTSKIDVHYIRKHHSQSKKAKAGQIGEYIEYLKTYRSILSSQVPPERYNGIINLIYISLYPNATTEEIESTLVNIK